MIGAIKQVVSDVLSTRDFLEVLTGVVESTKPLKVYIHEKLTLTSPFLSVAESLTPHSRIVTVDFDKSKNWSPDETGGKAISSDVSSDLPSYKSRKEVGVKLTFLDTIKKGDKLLLLKAQNDKSSYIIIDRIKEVE